ncbi:unnamed protein product [Ixodes persulcatus]
MAAGDHGPIGTVFHRMVGFSAALDWRPLLFVEPAIADRACTLCGVVCRKAVRLSCAHTLCSDCHAECVEQGGTCPLDQEPFCEDDVDQLECSAGYLGKSRVACWNAPSGCGFVGPVSSLLDHFGQCTFHTVSCPQCRSVVARSGVVRHCRDGCSSRPAADMVANNHLRLERDSIERARDELKEAMEKISEDLMFLQSGLNQCCEDIRATRATDASRNRLLEDLASRLVNLDALCVAGFAEEQRALRNVAADVNTAVTTVSSSRELVIKELCAQRDRLIAATEGVSYKLVSFCGPTTYHWYVADWTVMKATAHEGRTAFAQSATWNAFGYSVGLHLQLVKDKNQTTVVNCYFRIYPGGRDSELEWPFRKCFEFGIVHPQDGSNVLSHKLNADLHKKSSFQRPKGKMNLGFGAAPMCSADELDAKGFVSANTLHMYLRVEP